MKVEVTIFLKIFLGSFLKKKENSISLQGPERRAAALGVNRAHQDETEGENHTSE